MSRLAIANILKRIGDGEQPQNRADIPLTGGALDEDLKPWDLAKKQQEEARLKPWERAKLEQEEALALVRARARARMAQAQEGTSEARVQSEFEALNPLHKARRATMDIARLGLDGMTFGFGDKLLAGIEAAGRPGMDYDEALRLHRQATGDARMRAGLADDVAEIGAGFLPMNAAANAGLSAARLVPQGLSRGKALGAKLMAGGVEGAGYGALSGLGHDQNVGDAASLGACGPRRHGGGTDGRWCDAEAGAVAEEETEGAVD